MGVDSRKTRRGVSLTVEPGDRAADLTRLFGERLRAARLAAGATLNDLGDAVGGAARLSRIERGQISPTLRTVAAICDALGVSAVDLVNNPAESLRARLLEATRQADRATLLVLCEAAGIEPTPADRRASGTRVARSKSARARATPRAGTRDRPASTRSGR